MAKFYFDNIAVQEAILAYQQSKDIRIMYKYTEQLTALIRGVINTHKIYRFHNDVKELIQEAFVALYAALPRFDPTKGTAFSYLSIVVKQYLKNWTRSQNNKAFRTLEFKDTYYNDTDQQSHTLPLDEIFKTGSLPPKYDGLIEALTEGVTVERINNYQDMVKWLQKKGWTVKDIKAAFSILKKEYGRN